MYVDDDARLLDIAEAARDIATFINGFEKESFMRDRKTQVSVLYELAVIGEAVKRLSDEFRANHAEMAWRKIAGTRDVVVHGYTYVDLEQVWYIASEDVPALLTFVQPFLASENA